MKLVFEGDTLADIEAQVVEAGLAIESADPPETEEEKPETPAAKKKRLAAEKKKAAKVAKAAKEAEDDDDDDLDMGDDDDDESTVSLEDIRNIAVGLLEDKSPESKAEVGKILKKYAKTTKLSEMDEDCFEATYKALVKARDGRED